MEFETAVAKIKTIYPTLKNVCLQIGPWVIGRFDSLSEGKARHDLRQAGVEIIKQGMETDIEIYAETKKDLWKKYIDSSPEEKIFIKRDMDELDKECRRFQTIIGAIKLLPPAEKDENKADISLHWMDKFNELAGAQNEQWRQELLSKALAIEASSPGSIPPRGLWIIGTMEGEIFHAFAALLDVSAIIGSRPMIPNHLPFNENIIPTWEDEDTPVIGRAVYILRDTGILGDPLTNKRTITENIKFFTQYGGQINHVTTTNRLSVNGVMLAPLGDKLAHLYTPKPNALGKEIYTAWLDSLNKSTVTIEKAE